MSQFLPTAPAITTGIVLILSCGLASCRAQPGVTDIEVTDAVAVPCVKRFGINLGSTGYYDSSLVTKNLLYRNPGFEGEIYQSVISCSEVTNGRCIWESGSGAWRAGFWDGSRYEMISGAAKGRRGLISTSGPEPGRLAFGVSFAEGDVTPAPGDYLILRSTKAGRAEAGWWPHACCGGSIGTELSDVAPEGGKQALLLADAAGGEAEVSSFFGYSENRTFILLRGEYTLRFLAKGLGGADRLRVSISRSATPATVFLARTIPLSGKWEPYELTFSADEPQTATGVVQVTFTANHSQVLLDNVALEEAGSNPTIFRDSMVAALKELRPGILRYWGGQLGESFANQMEPAFARQRAGYSAWSREQEDIHIGLKDFLDLCEAGGAEPYYVVPITFSEEEMRSLVGFLARSRFSRIHLELGNEAWNLTFRGGSIEDPTVYAQRANDLFRAARRAPGFSNERFDLIVGGQAVDPERNQRILAASQEQDTLALAPYQANRIDSFRTNDEVFGPQFAEPQRMNARDGFMGRNKALLEGQARRTALAIYEVNANTIEGAISQQGLDDYVPSLGTGLAVIENMLLSLRDLRVTEQALWSLPQYSFRRTDGKTVKLYGAVVDMGVTNRKRPQFLALALANRALGGDMLTTRQHGSNPSWDQPALNGVPETRAQAVESFAFVSGSKRALILLNLQVTGALDVTFSGPNTPKGRVRVERLRSPDVQAKNEEQENVRIEEELEREFDPKSAFLLAPHSMTVLEWEQR
jgi:hypothetical protein